MVNKFIGFCLLLMPFFLNAQGEAIPQRFKAGLVLGMNTAQIDGDDSAGFHKFGIVGGLRGVVILTDKMELSMEMLFSQRGSRSSSNDPNVFPFKITLNYIEVPVAFNYLDWLEGDGEYYKLHFHAGFSYGRLLSQSSDDLTLSQLGEFFRTNDVSLLAGATFYANKHIGITARYSRSLFPLFERTDNSPNADPLIQYFFTFHAVYMF